jgi:glycerol-3-phosphate dehydrogenase (NAD(P)+)
MKISVLGAGGWGTTLAILLHYNGHKVTLWEFQKHYAKVLDKTRENKTFLPGIKIPDEIIITHDLDEASAGMHLIVLAVPSQFLRSVVKNIRPSDIKNTIIVNVAKGIENKSLMTMSQMLKDEIPSLDEGQIGVLCRRSEQKNSNRGSSRFKKS